MRLEITALAGGGRGVARHDGRVFMVAGALPGEQVEVEVERERAGIVEARTVAVLVPSPWREPDPCPVAAACGGCDLAHVKGQAVCDVARAVVVGALRHARKELAERVAQASVVTSVSGATAWSTSRPVASSRRRFSARSPSSRRRSPEPACRPGSWHGSRISEGPPP